MPVHKYLSMPYTFELTEQQLLSVTDYLDTVRSDVSHQYILGVEHRVTDDLIWVTIDCTAATALWIGLAIL